MMVGNKFWQAEGASMVNLSSIDILLIPSSIFQNIDWGLNKVLGRAILKCPMEG